MSKAIKCNTVDIINNYTKPNTPLALVLPMWLSGQERKNINAKVDIKYQARTFLSILREKDFNTIREWIEDDSGLDEYVLKCIWKTYQEFNDVEHIINRMCMFCLLKMKLDVTDTIDHFYSIEIINSDLYKEINSSTKRIGSQEDLWYKIAQQCGKFPIQSYVQEAIRLALVEIYEKTENDVDKKTLDQLIQGIKESDGAENIFVCKCKDICLRELQPMSLLKSMSLLHVYSSPPSKRKTKNPQRIQGHEKSESQEEILPTDSLSSNESIPNHLKLDYLKSFPAEINSSEISEVEVDDRFISPKNSDAARRNKETHKRSQKKKTKAVENTYRKGTDNYSNNIHHAEIFKVRSYDSMEKRQLAEKRMPEMGKEETQPSYSVSSNESIPNHLKLDNLKPFHAETEISEVEVDDRFISPENSDAARTNKETHKGSQKQKTKAVENTYRKRTGNFSNNIHHAGIFKVRSNDSMEKRQLAEKRMPEMGKEETQPSYSVSSNESIPNHLKLDNLKPFHAETEISEVEVDDRFISPENSDAARTNKETHKGSQKQKTKAVENTYRKRTGDFSNNIHHAGILKVCSNDSKEKGPNTAKRKTDMGKTEDKESSDDINSPVNYRTETQRMFVQQQKLKEKTTYTPFNITASHVYIHSTHITQSQQFSTDSGSS